MNSIYPPANRLAALLMTFVIGISPCVSSAQELPQNPPLSKTFSEQALSGVAGSSRLALSKFGAFLRRQTTKRFRTEQVILPSSSRARIVDNSLRLASAAAIVSLYWNSPRPFWVTTGILTFMAVWARLAYFYGRYAFKITSLPFKPLGNSLFSNIIRHAQFVLAVYSAVTATAIEAFGRNKWNWLQSPLLTQGQWFREHGIDLLVAVALAQSIYMYMRTERRLWRLSELTSMTLTTMFMVASAAGWELIFQHDPADFFAELLGLGLFVALNIFLLNVAGSATISTHADKHLTPQAIREILSKVQDIHRKNIAFHTIDGSRQRDYENVFKSGLLGRGPGHSYVPADWAASFRKSHFAQLFFNITGRFRHVRYQDGPDGQEIEVVLPAVIENGAWGQEQYTTVLFDMQRFREVEPEFGNENEINNRLLLHQFTASLGPSDFKWTYKDNQGRPIVHPQLGFVLKGRVSPRYFTGLVQGSDLAYKYPMTASAYQSRVETLAADMMAANSQHPERLLPIYDTKGNLHWPVKMDYAQVRKVAAWNRAAKRIYAFRHKLTDLTALPILNDPRMRLAAAVASNVFILGLALWRVVAEFVIFVGVPNLHWIFPARHFHQIFPDFFTVHPFLKDIDHNWLNDFLQAPFLVAIRLLIIVSYYEYTRLFKAKQTNSIMGRVIRRISSPSPVIGLALGCMITEFTTKAYIPSGGPGTTLDPWDFVAVLFGAIFASRLDRFTTRALAVSA